MTDSSSGGTAGNLSKAYTSSSIYPAFSPKDTALRPLVAPPAWSNQSRPDSHNTVATPTLYSDDWGLLLANPLLPNHPQVLEHPALLSDEEMANGTFMIQNHGLDVYLTQSQLAPSHHRLPQIDSGPNQEQLLPYNNQSTASVSIDDSGKHSN